MYFQEVLQFPIKIFFFFFLYENIYNEIKPMFNKLGANITERKILATLRLSFIQN